MLSKGEAGEAVRQAKVKTGVTWAQLAEAVGRPLAEEQEQGRFGETLDPREDVPAPAVVVPGARPASHPATCKTHM